MLFGSQIIKQIEQKVIDGNKIQEKSCFPRPIDINSLPWRINNCYVGKITQLVDETVTL